MFSMTPFERWTLGVSVVAVLFNAALFLGFGFQLRLLRDQIRQASEATERDHDQRRKGATLEFVTATLDRVGNMRRQGLPELNRAAVEPFTSNPADFSDQRNELTREYLNGYEAFATGVNLGLFDIAVVHALRGSTTIRSWALFEPWIQARRELVDDPALYTELERLADDLRVFARAQGLPDVSIH